MFNHVEARNFLVSYECLAQVCFHSVFIRLLDFLIYLVITVNTVFFVVRIFLCSSLLCKRCVFYSIIILVSCLFISGVLGPWEFSGGPGHILSLCVFPLCRVPGRYNFI